MNIVLIVIGILAFILIIPRILLAFLAWRMKGKDAPVLHKPSKKSIKSGAKTLLYFYTPSCGACKIQGPIINKFRKKYPEAVFKIDASKNRDAAKAYGVLGVPFVAYIQGSKVVKAGAGVQRESAITQFFEEED